MALQLCCKGGQLVCTTTVRENSGMRLKDEKQCGEHSAIHFGEVTSLCRIRAIYSEIASHLPATNYVAHPVQQLQLVTER